MEARDSGATIQRIEFQRGEKKLAERRIFEELMMVNYSELRKNKDFRLKGLIEYQGGKIRKTHILVD